MKEWYYKHKETVNYIFWCAMTTAVSWLAFSIYSYLLGLIEAIPVSVSVLIANTLSWITAVTFSFVANKIRVFESKSWAGKVLMRELPSFISARLLSLGVEELGLFIMIGLMAFDKWEIGLMGFSLGGDTVAKLFMQFVVIVMNYVFSKLVIFKKGAKD